LTLHEVGFGRREQRMKALKAFVFMSLPVLLSFALIMGGCGAKKNDEGTDSHSAEKPQLILFTQPG